MMPNYAALKLLILWWFHSVYFRRNLKIIPFISLRFINFYPLFHPKPFLEALFLQCSVYSSFYNWFVTYLLYILALSISLLQVPRKSLAAVSNASFRSSTLSIFPSLEHPFLWQLFPATMQRIQTVGFCSAILTLIIPLFTYVLMYVISVWVHEWMVLWVLSGRISSDQNIGCY